MADRGGYGQFCPVSMASEIICTRWTLLLLREFMCGSTRFNDLRRGVPKMSPSLLSKRLKELEIAGVIRTVLGERGVTEYHLTEAGEDLRPVVMGVGTWGQKWVQTELSLRNLDPSLLMWDIRRWIIPAKLPVKSCTIQFVYPELPEHSRNWWLVVSEGDTDLCLVDPGFEVDLMVTGPLRSMTMVWMGMSRLAQEVATGQLRLDGDNAIARDMERWLGLSPFAGVQRQVA